jgi:hypothetical protein
MSHEPAGLRLQERDFQVFRAIAESPACSRANLAAAFFNGSYEAAKKRIQQLAGVGFVRNDSVGFGRSILSLTEKGAELLIAHAKTPPTIRTSPVSPRMIRHERMLADCQFALTARADEQDCLVDFSNDPEKAAFCVNCSDHALAETVRPDGFCSIQTGFRTPKDFFFIEIDRSTETQGHLIHLGKQYRSYRRSGEFTARFGNQYEANQPSFRVLLIMKSPQRLENTLKNLRFHAGVGTLFWLTVFDSFVRDPFGRIWRCPADSDDASGNEMRSLF